MGIAERKAREKQIRSDQILESAYQVFQQVGYTAATMDQIAERAELAKGTLYIYFKSKEEVYFSLLINGLDILINLLEEAEASGKMRENPLQETAKTLFLYYTEYTHYFRIFMVMRQEDMQAKLTPDLSAEINKRATSILNLLVCQVQRMIPEDASTQINPWHVANLLWGAFIGITQLALAKEQLKARATQNDDLLCLCFDLIGRGLLSTGTELTKPGKRLQSAKGKRNV